MLHHAALTRRQALLTAVAATGSIGPYVPQPCWALDASPSSPSAREAFRSDPVLQDIREDLESLDRGRGSEALLRLEDERLFACRDQAGLWEQCFFFGDTARERRKEQVPAAPGSDSYSARGAEPQPAVANSAAPRSQRRIPTW